MYLILRLERFLRRSGMPPTRFGREAMSDPRFVFDLRNGREMRPKTARRLTDWLDRHEHQGQRPCGR